MNARKTDLLKQTARATPRRLHLRDAGDGDSAVYAGVGTDLRAARQRARLDVAALAEHLRIQPSYLEAIEDGRFADLPGTPYALGFVRSYAAFFDLDADELVRRFKQEASVSPPSNRLIFPEPVEQPQRPRAWLIVLCLIVAAAGFAGWRYLEDRGRADIAAVTPPPERLANLVAAPASPPQASSPTDTAEPSAPSPSGLVPRADASQGPATRTGPAGSANGVEETTPQAAAPASAGPATTAPGSAPSGIVTSGTETSGADAAGDASDAMPELPAIARAAVEVARLNTRAEEDHRRQRLAARAPAAAAPVPAGPASTESESTGAASTDPASTNPAGSSAVPADVASDAVSRETAADPAAMPANGPLRTGDAPVTAAPESAPLPASLEVERRLAAAGIVPTSSPSPRGDTVVRPRPRPETATANDRDPAPGLNPAQDTAAGAPGRETASLDTFADAPAIRPAGARPGLPDDTAAPVRTGQPGSVIVDPAVRRRVGEAVSARKADAVAAILPADAVVPTAPPPAERDELQAAVADPVPAGETGGAARDSEEAPAAAADEAPSAPILPSGRQPQIFGASNSDARVVIRARADSWVQVQGDGNELLLTRMLRIGDTFRVPDRDDLVLMTGNAGAIDIIVDGRRLGPLGPNGEVRRNVPLTAEALTRIAQSRGG